MGFVHNSPFSALGTILRSIRQRLNESLLEASAAVEISGERLARFENGELRPTEDVLDLLIRHYALEDKEADAIWELSGYRSKTEHAETVPHMLLLATIDNRILYSDAVQVAVNDNGVVINFMQVAGNQHPATTARIGMSKENAKLIVEIMQKSLDLSNNGPEAPEQKRLQA